MFIIADASTLILLQKIGLLERLIIKFKLVITPGVYREAVENGKVKNAPDAYALEKKISRRLISVERLKNSKTVKDLMLKFGTEQGETEAIALQLEKKEGLVAVDDHKAIVMCNFYGIPFATALTLVLVSKDAGEVNASEAKKMVTQLSAIGRYKSDLIISALEILEGEENG